MAYDILMLSREQFLGANLTITAPYVLACCGWDEATMTRHLMGKLAVDGDSDRASMVVAPQCMPRRVLVVPS